MFIKHMKRHAPVWAPDGEGGSGGDAGEQEGQGESENAGEGDKSGSIMDFASQDQGQGQEDSTDQDAWKMPEGLELPDHLVGLSADDTLSKVAKAYQGARRELSSKGKGTGSLEGEVPGDASGYVIEADGDDDKVGQELNSEASKPVMDAFRAAALKSGIPDKAFAQFMREGISNAMEAGIPIGMSNEEAIQISGEAEFKALTEEVGVAEAGTIINTLDVYSKKLQANKILTSDEDVAEFNQMVGTARAARIFQRILTGELGEKPIPPGDGLEGAATPTEAQAQYAAALSLPEGAERNQAIEAATKTMERTFGTNSSGSVRSSVL